MGGACPNPCRGTQMIEDYYTKILSNCLKLYENTIVLYHHIKIFPLAAFGAILILLLIIDVQAVAMYRW